MCYVFGGHKDTQSGDLGQNVLRARRPPRKIMIRFGILMIFWCCYVILPGQLIFTCFHPACRMVP